VPFAPHAGITAWTPVRHARHDHRGQAHGTHDRASRAQRAGRSEPGAATIPGRRRPQHQTGRTRRVHRNAFPSTARTGQNGKGRVQVQARLAITADRRRTSASPPYPATPAEEVPPRGASRAGDSDRGQSAGVVRPRGPVRCAGSVIIWGSTPRLYVTGSPRPVSTRGTRPDVTSAEAQRLVELSVRTRSSRRANEILQTASAFLAAAELDRKLRRARASPR
jgi:hypothetical protein